MAIGELENLRMFHECINITSWKFHALSHHWPSDEPNLHPIQWPKEDINPPWIWRTESNPQIIPEISICRLYDVEAPWIFVMQTMGPSPLFSPRSSRFYSQITLPMVAFIETPQMRTCSISVCSAKPSRLLPLPFSRRRFSEFAKER
jgi:hypothetical protein